MAKADTRTANPKVAYRLEEQVGFLLRKANQRHTAIFARHIPGDLTPMQLAAMAKLADLGECSQNYLGRLIAIDAATIKGVVDRLTARGLVVTRPDETDRRRMVVALSPKGRQIAAQAFEVAREISAQTLNPLSAEEQRMLLQILLKIS